MIDNRESRLAVQWCYMTSPYPAIRCSFVTVCSFAILGCPSINLVLQSETPRHSAAILLGTVEFSARPVSMSQWTYDAKILALAPIFAN